MVVSAAIDAKPKQNALASNAKNPPFVGGESAKSMEGDQQDHEPKTARLEALQPTSGQANSVEPR